MLTQALWVGVGGFLGSLVRFGVGRVLNTAAFPFGTLTVNIVGCFLISFLAQASANKPWHSIVVSFAMIGFLGAFTTFSAFSFETLKLYQAQQNGLAAVNIFASLILCFAAVCMGHVVGSWLS